MAENKKGFILYCDLIHTIKKMPDDKAGLLFKHLLAYVNDENPTTDDLLIELTFEPIKQQLKRDLNKWENELIKKGDSGSLGNLKRWNEDLYNKVISKELSLQKAVEIAKHRRESQCDKNSRTVSQDVANIAVIDIVKVKDINKLDFNLFWNLYPKKIARAKCEPKWNKLTFEQQTKIISTLPNFIKYKPFESYTHPNPETYLNQERWNDEIQVNNKNNETDLDSLSKDDYILARRKAREEYDKKTNHDNLCN